MATMWAFGLEKLPETVSQRPIRIIRVQDICLGRGVDPPTHGSPTVYVDEVLGYAVSNFVPSPADDWKASFLLKDIDIPLVIETTDPLGFIERALDYEDEDAAALKVGQPPWHVNSLGGWPCQTGEGQRVAVLDSGIGSGIPQLPRKADNSDFCSAIKARATTNDMDSSSHGTRCAGIIGARMGTAPRQSVAPGCCIYAAQITTGNGVYTRMSSLLLMLSWAVHCAKARVINMSFSASGACQKDPAFCALFSYVVGRLREKNLALVFAAALGGDTRLAFPANAGGVVAVGRYKRDDRYAPWLVIDTTSKPNGFLSKPDLLFGPGQSMASYNSNGTPGKLGGLSAACAFVSGIAALYMQEYSALSVNQVLDVMKTKAITAYDEKGQPWRCVQFP